MGTAAGKQGTSRNVQSYSSGFIQSEGVITDVGLPTIKDSLWKVCCAHIWHAVMKL